MANQVKVKVLRHLNGEEFLPGAKRTLDVADAERLAATGAVEILGQKMAAAPRNKMKAAPANKAARRSRAK